MAIIIRGRTTCPLCSEVIEVDQPIVATSHFIGSPEDPLWHFSDAGLHRACFLAWSLRSQFVARYNEIVGGYTAGNGTYKHMQNDGTILVLVRNPFSEA